jgi:hypothetical protein
MVSLVAICSEAEKESLEVMDLKRHIKEDLEAWAQTMEAQAVLDQVQPPKRGQQVRTLKER